MAPLSSQSIILFKWSGLQVQLIVGKGYGAVKRVTISITVVLSSIWWLTLVEILVQSRWLHSGSVFIKELKKDSTMWPLNVRICWGKHCHITGVAKHGEHSIHSVQKRIAYLWSRPCIHHEDCCPVPSPSPSRVLYAPSLSIEVSGQDHANMIWSIDVYPLILTVEDTLFC